MKAAFYTLGCKVNQYETEYMAETMKNAGFHTDYILFDACYMGNVETAYELKDVTDFLVASSMEISSMGVPYRQAAPYLLGSPDYEKICQTYYYHNAALYEQEFPEYQEKDYF